MLVLLRRRNLFMLAAGMACLMGLTWYLVRPGARLGSAPDGYNYRVFVAGLGSVAGKWSGECGIAVIGLETRPALEDEEELKLIDLLIANGGSQPLEFKSDIALIDDKGSRFTLTSEGQPRVLIGPGQLSQGTVIIPVPRGIPDDRWTLEISGGTLATPIKLPLKVLKVAGE